MDFTLNGRAVVVEVAPGESLLGVLRGACGLRSMKDGCAPEGSCGACTVIVDGRAVVSCAQPAGRVEGRVVETLEGLPAADRDLWADAFVATGASQCGYCSPGIVMKAEALLRRDPAPAREAVARALAGNLCRCTGYALDPRCHRAGGRHPARGRGCPRDPGRLPARGHGALRGTGARPGREAVRRGPRRARHAPGRAPFRGGAAGDRAPHRHDPRPCGPGRGRHRDRRRRAGPAGAGAHRGGLAAARRHGRDDALRGGHPGGRRRGDPRGRDRGGGPGRGGAGAAAARDGSVRRPGGRRPRPPRGRQPGVPFRRAARGRRCGARVGGARGARLLPHPVDRARLPGAGGEPRGAAGRHRARWRARDPAPGPRLLRGPGRLGGPAPGRIVPGAAAGRGAGHPGLPPAGRSAARRTSTSRRRRRSWPSGPAARSCFG